MPEDDAEGLDEEWAKTDVKIDPTGSTLSSTVGDVPLGTPVEVVESVNGDEDVRTRLPGGGDRSADIERTFYVKDPGAPGGWRELSPEELPGGSPAHAGEYKVVSGAVKEVLDDGTEVPYAPAESVFAVTPKKVDASELFAGQSLEKVYDGEASIDAAGLVPDLSFALPGADVHVLFDAEAQLDDLSVAATMATISGIRLSGADAGDYRVEGLDSGALEVPAKVLPRELTVRAVPSVVWGRTGLPLSDTSGSPVSYRSDLAVYSGSGEWRPNMLAPRDGRVENGAVVSILGDERFDCSCGGRALDALSPAAGLYKLTLAYSAVHGPAKGRAADRAGIAPRDAVFDAITPSLIGGGRWDIGNYVLELVDGAVAVADDPAARPSGGKEPSPDLPRLPGFLEAAASEVASPEKPPLSPADIEKIVSEKSGAKGPATSVAIFRDGEEADAIDRTVPGTWTVVATYPDPDGGQDIAVRLTYTLTEPSVVVADDEVEVPYDPDGAPKGPDDIAREVGDEYGDRLPEGVEPEVRIERDGEPVAAVDPSVPGEYVVTLTYHDPDGGPDKIVRRVYRVLAPAADGPDNGGAAAKSPGALPRTGDPSAPLAAGLAGLSAAALAAMAASVRSRRRG